MVCSEAAVFEANLSFLHMLLSTSPALQSMRPARCPAADGTANPLTPHIVSCLRGSTASARQLGALVVTHWAQEQHGAATSAGAGEAQASLPPDLQQLLGVLLELLTPGGTQAPPFAELAPLYAQLRSQASAVVARGVAAGVPLALSQPLESLGAEGALALAAQIPAGAGESFIICSLKGFPYETDGVILSKEEAGQSGA